MGRSIYSLALFTTVISICRATGFCSDYAECMEQLEKKQRECLTIEKNLKLRNADTCSRRKWAIKTELNALHLRRTELARDCVNRVISESDIAESTLNATMTAHCESLHQKFQFTPGVAPTVTKSFRRKRSSGKRDRKSGGGKKQRQMAHDCRKSCKSWHKQCSALAHCCPMAVDCKLQTSDVMDQIRGERRKLREAKEECEKL